MMPNKNLISISDNDFNNLCSHYKDSYENHLSTIKKRDTLFFLLLIILGLFTFQISSAELINQAASNYINNLVYVSLDKSPGLISSLIWLFLFGFSARYYQTVIQINRQYSYIHELENLINKRYEGTKAFTREGSSYLEKYPLFLNWMSILYTLMFPLIIMASLTIKIRSEIIANNMSWLSISCAGFITLSTIFYLFELHWKK